MELYEEMTKTSRYIWTGRILKLVLCLAVLVLVVGSFNLFFLIKSNNLDDNYDCDDATYTIVKIAEFLHVPYEIQYGHNPGESEDHVWLKINRYVYFDWGIKAGPEYRFIEVTPISKEKLIYYINADKEK